MDRPIEKKPVYYRYRWLEGDQLLFPFVALVVDGTYQVRIGQGKDGVALLHHRTFFSYDTFDATGFTCVYLDGEDGLNHAFHIHIFHEFIGLKSFALDEEEFRMGVKSKAQLEVQRDEFEYKTQSTALQLEGLRHDSAATILRRELMKNDLERERKKYDRAQERMENLIVRAPLAGQLSFVKVTPGQQVQSTEAIAEIKVLPCSLHPCGTPLHRGRSSFSGG